MYNYLHEEVLKLLARHETSYATPMNSQEIGEILKVTPSYIRGQLSQLAKAKKVGVRRGNGGGYYVIKKERQQMQPVNENKEQLENLGVLLEDMKKYLHGVEEGCQSLPVMFHVADKSQPLEILAQIMEGLHYYQKLLKSASVLLTIDLSESLCEGMSVLAFYDHICQMFTSVFEATENEDYSLLADLIEYDLVSAIHLSQEMLGIVQGRYEERVM